MKTVDELTQWVANKIKNKYPDAQITFCNGGDRGKDNIPEMEVKGINFEFSVGGNDKKNSSSWILKEWQYESEERIWGKFYILFTDDKVKLKELIVAPGKGMSLQKNRSSTCLLNPITFVLRHYKLKMF